MNRNMDNTTEYLQRSKKPIFTATAVKTSLAQSMHRRTGKALHPFHPLRALPIQTYSNSTAFFITAETQDISVCSDTNVDPGLSLIAKLHSAVSGTLQRRWVAWPKFTVKL